MDRCDVLVVGGGPAGSSCARRLVQAGCDVAILDKASFPRDKVCTGWITPAVVRTLELDLAEYGVGRTVQPFAGFRTGPIDGDLLLTDFQHTISYGIRRFEFDDYLLRRSGARLLLGQPLVALRRDGDEWVANDFIKAPMIVGAGGHFCPIARRLNAARHEDVVVAQEAEYRLDDRDGADLSGERGMARAVFLAGLARLWLVRAQGDLPQHWRGPLESVRVSSARTAIRGVIARASALSPMPGLVAGRAMPTCWAARRCDGFTMPAWCSSATRPASPWPRAAKAF